MTNGRKNHVVTYLELGDKLRHMFTLFLWLDDTFLFWLLADDSLDNVVALLRSLGCGLSHKFQLKQRHFTSL